MSLTIILNNLSQNKLVTQSDLNRLRNTGASRPFLATLIDIYESKAKLYLQACHSGVKKALQEQGVQSNQIDPLTIEKMMECAYNAFLESHKFSSLPSLRLLLMSKEPELLPSLGLKTLSPSNDLIQEVAKKVFIAYTARYRLFHSVDTTALQTLCQEAEREDPLLFPTYLFDALRLESQLASTIQTSLQGEDAAQIPVRQAQKVQSDPESFTACLKGIIFYVGTLIGNSSVSSTLHDRYFYHLNNRQGNVDFAGRIAAAYVSEMQDAQNQREVMQANATGLASATSRVCLPALKLLGMPVEVDLSALNQRLQNIREAIQRNESARSSLESQFNQAKNEANQKITQWRNGIPDRPVTFGMSFGMPF